MLYDFDYAAHNRRVRALLSAANEGRAGRVRMELSTNPRIALMDPVHNPERVSFEDYMSDPSVMARYQLRYFEYLNNDLCFDHIMGEEADLPALYPDFQNLLEPDWFGCPLYFPANGEPCARHFLDDAHKYAYIERGMIAPVSGLIARAGDFIDYFEKLCGSGFSYNGKRARFAQNLPGMGTDGPLTICCGIRGATDMCADLREDAEYAEALLDYVTDNIINRVKTLRRMAGMPEKSPSFYLADDSIALISRADYEAFVLPRHKRLIRELTTGAGNNSMHLCGDATRHFATIARELRVTDFDTGYPVNHGALARELGGGVTIRGGVRVDILRAGTRAQVIDETKRILNDVLPCKNFVIKEANNLSPQTPPENIRAMYETVCEFGVY